MNVVLIGFMGTGKTAVGKRLARRLGTTFVDVDSLIEAVAKRTIARIFAERGEAVFRRLERRQVARVVRGRHQVIAVGGGAFVDPQSRRRLQAAGPVVCLTASPRAILSRVGKRLATRPMLAGASNPLAKIQQLLAERAAAYAEADLTVDTTDLAVERVVERLVQSLGPNLCRSWQYVLDHSRQLAGRYGGKYVVVMDERVVASGTTHLEAYQHAARRLPIKRDVGIYYIPLPEESLTAFCAPSRHRRPGRGP